MGKFFESGKLSNVMPSGHMARELPKSNFKAQNAPQVKAKLPPTAGDLARNQMIVQQLRSAMASGAHGLSPGTAQVPRTQSKIASNPGQLPRTAGPTSGRTRFGTSANPG